MVWPEDVPLPGDEHAFGHRLARLADDETASAGIRLADFVKTPEVDDRFPRTGAPGEEVFFGETGARFAVAAVESEFRRSIRMVRLAVDRLCYRCLQLAGCLLQLAGSPTKSLAAGHERWPPIWHSSMRVDRLSMPAVS